MGSVHTCSLIVEGGRACRADFDLEYGHIDRYHIEYRLSFSMASLFKDLMSPVRTNGLNYFEGFFSSLGFSLSEACKSLKSRSLFLIRR